MPRTDRATAPGQDKRNGRFRSAYDEDGLVEVVREASLAVDPTTPESVTPDAYHDALAADAGSKRPRWPGAPSADVTRRRLGRMPWYELLALINSERSTKHYPALIRRREENPATVEEVIAALQAIATRLGVDSLRPHEFAAERAVLVAEDARAWRHSTGLDDDFPTHEQVAAVFRTETEPGWDRALRAAGLASCLDAGGRRGMDPVGVAEVFLCDVGCLPWGRRALKDFAKSKGVSLVCNVPGAAELSADLAARRAPTGLWTPPAPPPQHERPAIDVEEMENPAVARRTSWPRRPE